MSALSQHLQQLGIMSWTQRLEIQDQPIHLMFIGAENAPLVDREDQLLTMMIKTLGYERSQVLVTHCSPLLDKQIAEAQPQLLIAIGSTAAEYLLKTKAPLESLRNEIHYYGENKTPLIMTYHPTDLLRHPADKKNAFLDLRFIQRTIRSP